MTIEITNFSPFANMRYANTLSDGRAFGILMVKGSYDIADNGSCTVSEEQEPINFTDSYHGELNISALRHPSEFVPYKPGTDVILNCTAHTPEGTPAKDWIVGVQVSDETGIRATKILRAYGPRSWIPKWRRELSDDEKKNWKEYRELFIRWELSEPEPVTNLAIRYEYAFGGLLSKKLKGEEEQEVFEYNTVGRGWIDPEWTDHTKPIPAPQIVFESEHITDPYKKYYPAGFGPVPPVWLPRRPLGGTYDKEWLDTVWPKWPADYNMAYHQSAAYLLTVTPHIVGDFSVQLLNLKPNSGGKIFTIQCPDAYVYLSLRANWELDEESSEPPWRHVRMNLDTIHISDDLKRLFLVWRAAFDPKETKLININHGHEILGRLPKRARDTTPFAPKPEEVARHQTIREGDSQHG